MKRTINTNSRNRRRLSANNGSSYARSTRNPMLSISDSRRNYGERGTKRAKPMRTNSTHHRLTKSKQPIHRVSEARPVKLRKKTVEPKRVPATRQVAQSIKSTGTVPYNSTQNKQGNKNPRRNFKKPFDNKGRYSIRHKNGVMRIIPLGGCEEVGRNMTVFEYFEEGKEKDKDIILLDMGLQFPEEDMPGIDYIIPNIEYLKGQEKNIRAVLFSHGHLDHIGAAPILLERLGNPLIIGRDLTIEMIKHRVEDYKKGTSKNLRTIYIKNIKDQHRFGAITLKYFAVEHSIKDAVGMILETPAGTIIHPGDWTMEDDPMGRPLVDYSELSKLKEPKILMLEALAAQHKEASRKVTEKEMFDNLTTIINESPGRIIIGTFASQVERIKQIIDIAAARGKKVALDGFSMKMNIEIATKLGYIKIKQGAIINIKDINKYDDNKLVILATGAQGESNAVLSRIVNNNHKSITLKKSDTIVFSSSVIPGNERTIQRLKDNLYRLCDNVIHSDIMDVHVSGHGNVEDIKNLLRQIKPTYFIPVYANHYMLKEAAKVAEGMGYAKDKIFVPDNGSVIDFNTNKKPLLHDKKINTDYVFVDGLGVGDVSNIVLRDRQMMAGDGMIVVIVTIAKRSGKLLHSPDLISRGFIYMKENKAIIENTRRKVKQILKDTDPNIEAFPDYIKNKIRNEVGHFLFKKTERRPMVLPVVIEV